MTEINENVEYYESKDPVPREGTETAYQSGALPFADIICRKTLFPERGRKPDSSQIVALGKPSEVERPCSPRGDGNSL